jgi:hypothetical protein
VIKDFFIQLNVANPVKVDDSSKGKNFTVQCRVRGGSNRLTAQNGRSREMDSYQEHLHAGRSDQPMERDEKSSGYSHKGDSGTPGHSGNRVRAGTGMGPQRMAGYETGI